MRKALFEIREKAEERKHGTPIRGYGIGYPLKYCLPR
jgi:hypothetical protein